MANILGELNVLPKTLSPRCLEMFQSFRKTNFLTKRFLLGFLPYAFHHIVLAQDQRLKIPPKNLDKNELLVTSAGLEIVI